MFLQKNSKKKYRKNKNKLRHTTSIETDSISMSSLDVAQ